VELSAFYAHTLRFRLIRVYRPLAEKHRSNFARIEPPCGTTSTPLQLCQEGFYAFGVYLASRDKVSRFVKARSQMPGISKQISAGGVPTFRSSRVSPKLPRASRKRDAIDFCKVSNGLDQRSIFNDRPRGAWRKRKKRTLDARSGWIFRERK